MATGEKKLRRQFIQLVDTVLKKKAKANEETSAITLGRMVKTNLEDNSEDENSDAGGVKLAYNNC